MFLVRVIGSGFGKARHLLEHEVFTTVNEVAQAAGYSSGSYLTKVYEDRSGKKPGEYFQT